MSWFNDKFFAEVSGPADDGALLQAAHAGRAGGGAPDTEAIRAARHNINYHLAYIGWLVRTRDWLAGDQLTYADLAAAAHLSAVDYLGDVPWNEDETAKNWYARLKSRPSFRPLLAETWPASRRRRPTPTWISESRTFGNASANVANSHARRHGDTWKPCKLPSSIARCTSPDALASATHSLTYASRRRLSLRYGDAHMIDAVGIVQHA